MSVTAKPADTRTVLRDALRAVSDMQEQLAAAERVRHEPIAIIGMGCRFPGGADSPEALWQLLSNGVDAIREVPASRWTAEQYAALDPDEARTSTVRYGGFVDGIDQFDPHFFGIAPREAVTMDPQHRMVLEVCWEALERSGQAADRLRGSLTGVFLGITSNDYATHLRFTDPTRLDVYSASGNVHNSAAGRVSYLLGLHGPSMAIDTACSASLTAIHLACQSLRLGESNLALAGGVNSILVPDAFVSFGKWGMMAPDGRCKTFDAAADGFVRAEGCGMLALKRLSDAVAAGDPVLAVIRGSAVNQDGPSSGLTVPNGPAQEAVLRKALSVARIKPSAVSYVEAHGTGTSLGDPIELEALDAVMSEGREPGVPLVVGAIKTNLGHLEAASGVAGLIKVVLALQHGSIPANLHFRRLNPAITLRKLEVTVPTAAIPWPAGPPPRIAGISSFGFSGTNAHVVVGEAPQPAPAAAPHARPAYLVAISGKSTLAVSKIALRWREHLANAGQIDLADVARSSTTGRSHFSHRAAIVATSAAQLDEQLSALADGRATQGVTLGELADGEVPKVAFLFTGQGSQYAGMATDLYRSQPAFREALDRCDRILRPLLDKPLLSVLYEASPDSASIDAPSSASIDQTAYTQPALFAVEYSLYEMWRSWGIEADAVLGHSVGEYVAACVAGVFSLEDALTLIALRGRLMQALPAGGGMAAVLCDEARVRAVVQRHGTVSIAAVNGPDNVVISGPQGAVQSVVAALEAEGVSARALTVSHAFHSALMEPMLREFEQAARQVAYAPPRIALISNVTGQPMSREDAPNADYWCRHIREAVRFADGVRSLHDLGYRVFLEAGPAPTLLAMARRVVPAEGSTWLPSLRRGRNDWQEVLSTLGALYAGGADIDWQAANREAPGRQIALPTYPFARERYWVDPPAGAASAASRAVREPAAAGHPLLGAPLRTATGVTLFEQQISSEQPAYLSEHVIHGEAVFPAAGFVEILLAAADTLGPSQPAVIHDFVVAEPLLLPSGQGLLLQTVLTPGHDGETAVEIFSTPSGRPTEPARWTSHASARVRMHNLDPAPAAAAPLEAIQRRCGQEGTIADLLREHEARGITYGPSFRGLERIWSGDHEALGLLHWPARVAAEASQYLIHPAILDACLQLLGAAVPREGASIDDVYLPVGIERVRRMGGGRAMWSHVEVHMGAEPAPAEFTANVTLFDEDRTPVAQIVGLRLRRATREALRRATRRLSAEWLYDVEWQPMPPEPAAAAARHIEGTWVILADRGTAGSQLASRVTAAGAHAVVIPADEQGDDLPLHAERVARLEQVCRQAVDAPRSPIRGFIHLRSLDEGNAAEPAAAPSDAIRRGAGTFLHLVQGLLRAQINDTRIWVVTRASQPAGALPAVDPTQAPVWALARTVSAEHPQMRCLCIDLDAAPEGDESERLWRVVSQGGDESQVALRGSRTLVARLVPSVLRERGTTTERAVALETSARGMLENLRLQPLTRRPPGAGEVEVKVTHAGLNFRDVLNALGMYPGEPGPLGAECVGVVSAVGAGVSHLKTGDEVLGMAGGSLRSYVTTAADLMAIRPPSLSSEEAATLPITFLTAEYALNRLAGLRRGERVLIHAAAGGVGLAAVQLAQRAGAEIFATAGNPAKRELLKGMGVAHVLDSRSLAFADEIQARTQGHGVDVVLNSLAGEFIDRSVASLAPGGRFIEIGKSGIWTTEQMAAVRPDVKYFTLYLGEVEPALIQEMLTSLLAEVVAGHLQPLPRRVYSLDAAEQAFRFMAQAKHVGKIVLSFGRDDDSRIRPDATYLVTGGLSGLGLATAQWLAERGATRLALVGRSGATTAGAVSAVAELKAAGVDVLTIAADVGNADDCARVFKALADGPELRGIIHAAGILNDGTVEQLEWIDFERVFAAKVAGAWHLHQHGHGRALDFFVMFSSASALIGTPGQGNYATANAFLDSFAHARRASGLAATSINWGPWGELGMASELASTAQQRWHRLGIGLIDRKQGLAVLEQVIAAGVTQVGVLPINWHQLARSIPGGVVPMLFADLAARGTATRAAAAAAPATRPALLEQLDRVPEKGRRVAIQGHVRDVVRQVLGVDRSFTLELTHGLRELGMDSLMAVELRNHLQASIGRSLPSTLAFDRPTISALSGYLEQLIGEAAVASQPAAAPPAPAPTTAPHADLDELSDEDAERLLAEELER